MQDKRFIILSSILIGVLSVILVMLLITIMHVNNIRKKNNVSGNTPIIKEESMENNTSENINDNVIQQKENKTPQEILDRLRPDTRIDEFYARKDSEQPIELLFDDTIANVYSDKMVCDKVLNITFNEVSNIIEQARYERVENSGVRIYTGREVTYERADIDDYKTEVFLDAEDNVIQIKGTWYTPYDSKVIDDTQYFSEEDLDSYLNCFSRFYGEIYNNDSVDTQDKISYSIKTLNQIDVSQNSILKSIYNDEELEKLQNYLAAITIEDIIQDDTRDDVYYKIEYELGDTKVSIMCTAGWYIAISITNINYEESDYYINYTALRDYCVNSKDLDDNLNEIQTYSSQQDEIEYINYTNVKYAFSIKYPDIFKNKMEGDANDGIILHTEDGTIRMIAYGQYNVNEMKIDQEYEYELAGLQSVVFSSKEGDWYEIKWQDREKTFYEKKYIDEDMVYIFQIEYLSDKEEEFNNIIPIIVNSFNVKLEKSIQ